MNEASKVTNYPANVLEHIFDLPIHVLASMVPGLENMSFENLLLSDLHRKNVLFNSFWSEVFGVYPSRGEFFVFMTDIIAGNSETAVLSRNGSMTRVIQSTYVWMSRMFLSHKKASMLYDVEQFLVSLSNHEALLSY